MSGSEDSEEYEPSSDGGEVVEEEETDSDENYTSLSEGSELGNYDNKINNN